MQVNQNNKNQPIQLCKYQEKCRDPACKFNHIVLPSSVDQPLQVVPGDQRQVKAEICSFGKKCRYQNTTCKKEHPVKNDKRDSSGSSHSTTSSEDKPPKQRG